MYELGATFYELLTGQVPILRTSVPWWTATRK